METFASLNALLDARIAQLPDRPVFLVPHRDVSKQGRIAFDKLTFGQLDRMMSNVCIRLAHDLAARKTGQPLRVVAVVGASALDLLVHEYALIRLGHAPFIMSPSNSVSTIARLMKQTGCTDVLFSQDNRKTIEAVRAIMFNDGVPLQRIAFLANNDLVRDPIAECPRSQLTYDQERDEVAIIMHSSGSSGQPKPLGRPHRIFTANMVGTQMQGLVTVPLHHSFGHGSALKSLYSARGMALMPHSLACTAENLVDLARSCAHHGFTHLVVVPFMLKLMAENEEGVNVLRQFKSVVFAGAPCPRALGDRLVHEDVPLISTYGNTENGVLLSSARDFAVDKEWEVLRPLGRFGKFMELEDVQHVDGKQCIYELVVPPEWPSRLRSNRDDGSYATGDLFTKHPAIPNGLVYAGRSDDMIVHVTGKKTSPGPMEQDILSSPFVRQAIVFGAGKVQTGCLIVPYEDLADARHQLQRIWPAIDEANGHAASHSRIVREMVKILPACIRLPSADKGSLKRAEVMACFAADIEAAYRTCELSKTTSKVKIVTIDQARQLVRLVIRQALAEQRGDREGDQLADDVNLFDGGCDSLTAVRAGKLLRSRLDLPHDTPFTSSAPFAHPSIAELAQFIFALSVEPEAK